LQWPHLLLGTEKERGQRVSDAFDKKTKKNQKKQCLEL
jgi:hypothetical protein